MAKETKYIVALNEILTLLGSSSDSLFAGQTVEELKRQVEAVRDAINLEKQVGKAQLSSLVAPTGSLQDTALDNGWGDEFLRIANELDLLK